MTGITEPGAMVSVENAALPIETTAERDGRFAADVPLRSNAVNRLHVEAAWPNGEADTTVEIRQQHGNPTGILRGHVIDSADGKPVGEATISYGASSTTTAANGSYTLTPVPDGTVVAKVRKPGFITQLAVATVADGQGNADVSALQALAEPVTVGPHAASFNGIGWRVDIPTDALAEPTPLQLTPLRPVGPLEALGLPIIDLAPSGLRFSKPITVTLDPATTGIDADDVHAIGLDPEFVTTRALPTVTTADRKVAITLRDLRGEQIFMGQGEDANAGPTWCRPYESEADANLASNYLREFLLPILTFTVSPDSGIIYSKYLTPGSELLSREAIVTAKSHRDFREDEKTRQALFQVWNEVRLNVERAPLPLGPPEDPTTRGLSDYPSIVDPGKRLGQLLNITWGRVFSAAANLAGGVGGAYLPSPLARSVPDERHIVGQVRAIPRADAKGVRTKVSLESDLQLHVLDAVDFCPGGSGNKLQYRLFLLAMSRLEATPHRNGGTWAKTILDEAWIELDTDSLNHDISSFYPTNDVDKDGVPDTQPWDGASYKLDNCPAKSNPNQADRDGDGIGDACDNPQAGIQGFVTFRFEGQAQFPGQHGARPSKERYSGTMTYRIGPPDPDNRPSWFGPEHIVDVDFELSLDQFTYTMLDCNGDLIAERETESTYSGRMGGEARVKGLFDIRTEPSNGNRALEFTFEQPIMTPTVTHGRIQSTNGTCNGSVPGLDRKPDPLQIGQYYRLAVPEAATGRFTGTLTSNTQGTAIHPPYSPGLAAVVGTSGRADVSLQLVP